SVATIAPAPHRSASLLPASAHPKCLRNSYSCDSLPFSNCCSHRALRLAEPVLDLPRFCLEPARQVRLFRVLGCDGPPCYPVKEPGHPVLSLFHGSKRLRDPLVLPGLELTLYNDAFGSGTPVRRDFDRAFSLIEFISVLVGRWHVDLATVTENGV